MAKPKRKIIRVEELELVQGGQVELVGMVVQFGGTLVFMTKAAFEQMQHRI